MKISEIPKDQRPREKLLNKGSNYLSNEELLAIFLRIGMKNKNAIDYY
jgi:DNA repair protein RadC